MKNRPIRIRTMILCGIAMCIVFFVAYRYSSIHLRQERSQALRQSFFTDLQQISKDSMGLVRPNYTDGNYVYFLTKDEGCIYRFSTDMTKPELLISNAVCFTVTEQGILFFRAAGNPSSLILWVDGQEYPVFCEDTSFFATQFAILGDYLFYEPTGSVSVCKISLDANTPTVSKTHFSIPDCLDLEDILWIDETTVWYLTNHSTYYGEISKMDISTGLVESLGISTIGSHDRRHDIYPAVKDGIYYYQVNGSDKNVYTLNLFSGTVTTIGTVPDEYSVCLYGDTTGQCYVQTRTYDGGDPVATTELKANNDVSYLARNTARTAFDHIIVANEYEVINYDCYHRTALYNEAGIQIWVSNGNKYLKDY